MPSQDQQGKVFKRRAVLLGATLLVVGVALWLLLRSEAVTAVIADSVVPTSSEELLPLASAVEVIASEADTQAPPSLGGFNVRLRLQYDSSDALVLRRVREYYEALTSGLRAVPGLHLVEEHDVPQGDDRAEFRLTIGNLDATRTRGLSTNSEWGAMVNAEVLSGDTAGTVYGIGMVGDALKGDTTFETIGPLSGDSGSFCAALTNSLPCNAAEIAERQVMALRKHVFPRDGSLERELEAQFLNSAQPKRERQRLMNDLKTMSIRLSDTMVREALARLVSPLDTNDAHARDERSGLLQILARQRNEAVVQPLIEFALHDTDPSARNEAASLLATNFPENSAVRFALEKLTADPNLRVQMTAAAALSRISEN